MPRFACPYCGGLLPKPSPYTKTAGRHEIIIECPTGTCKALVSCFTIGNRIAGLRPPRLFKHRMRMRAAGNWRSDVSQMIEEACKSNYLRGSRGAAVCLRIALEQIINIKLLGKNFQRPDRFRPLQWAINEAVGAGTLDTLSKLKVDKIKSLGDGAAHPSIGGPNSVVTPAKVDLVIGEMEELLTLVNVL